MGGVGNSKTQTGEMNTGRHTLNQAVLNLIICVVLLIMAVAFWSSTAKLGYPSAVFPRLVIGLFTILVLVLGFSSWTRLGTGGPLQLGNRHSLTGLMATGAYLGLIPALGMYSATGLFLVAFLLSQDEAPFRPRAWLYACGTALVVTGAVFLVFDRALRVITPVGILF